MFVKLNNVFNKWIRRLFQASRGGVGTTDTSGNDIDGSRTRNKFLLKMTDRMESVWASDELVHFSGQSRQISFQNRSTFKLFQCYALSRRYPETISGHQLVYPGPIPKMAEPRFARTQCYWELSAHNLARKTTGEACESLSILACLFEDLFAFEDVVVQTLLVTLAILSFFYRTSFA